MKRAAFALVILICCLVSSAADQPKRPRILGIAKVNFYSTNVNEAVAFYRQVLGGQGTLGDEPIGKRPFDTVPIFLLSGQVVSLSKAPNTSTPSLLVEIVFATDNLKNLEKYLSAHNILLERTRASRKDYFSVLDPEGHRISFTEAPSPLPSTFSHQWQLIHAGFVVHDRAAMDRFYKDILGFHVYWHGGMKDDETNWVDMQVPDGTDWLEYMLKVPANADKHTLGVMNHIALGVPDIHAAEKQLRANGWNGTEQPKIGRDGKWQLNLYDPDDTRVELMEFTPTQKPCCSEYTGPHPGAQPSSKGPANP
jgi:catechol 2,3-dioxygenase-like lactoylglutathione lyase family enzyme